MELTQQLEILRETRKFLTTCYVPYKLDDGRGGHCQWGALVVASAAFEAHVSVQDFSGEVSYSTWAIRPMFERIEAASVELYAELVSVFTKQNYGGYGYFSVYVNNVLGKDAILRVYDYAIDKLTKELGLSDPIQAEMNAMCDSIAAQSETSSEENLTTPESGFQTGYTPLQSEIMIFAGRGG